MCTERKEANYLLCEIHEGVCDNYKEGPALAQKVLRHGCYWPTLKKDAIQFVKRCDK